MNNEEAIEVLKNDIEICTIQQEQACDMAIKALEQIEIWNATTKDRQIIAPKGTFRKIWEDEQQPSEDCISRKAVINTIFYKADNNSDVVLSTDLMDRIKHLPPVTPQPKIGKWIEDAKTYYEELNKRGLGVDEYTPYFNDDIACSECLAKYSVVDNETQFFKHCPNCGAKMEE